MKVCPQCDEQYPGDVEFCAKDGAKLRSAKESDEDPMIGRVLEGRYRIVERFSEGGMGAIYLARQETVGRQVAIKTLRTALADSQEFTDRFMREARVTSKISHPNCVTIHDFGQTDDTLLYLVMEYLEGETLADRLERETLSTEDAIQIAIQVSNALEATHAQDVVHRDLKPDNIFLLDAAGERIFVKVLDFGISKVADGGDESLTKTGQVFGTPEYMSPEQGRSKSLDGRSDLYSLGCILYEVLSGSPPFRADTPMAVLVSHIQEEPRPLDEIADVPEALADLVGDLLTKDVDERPASAAVVRRRLEEIRSDMAGNRPSKSIGNVKTASEATESSVSSSEGESNRGGASEATGGDAAARGTASNSDGNQDGSPIDSEWGQAADSDEYESSGTSVWLAVALFVAFAVLLVGGAFAIGSFAYYEWGDGAVAAADAGDQSGEGDPDNVAASNDESAGGSDDKTDEAEAAGGDDKPENWAELKKEFLGGEQQSEDGEVPDQSGGTADGDETEDGESGSSTEASAGGAASPDETESGESESEKKESAAGGSEQSGGARPPDRVAGGGSEESSQGSSEEGGESTGEVATPSDDDGSTGSEETTSGGSKPPETNEEAEKTDQSEDESPKRAERDESPGSEEGPESPPEQTEEAEPPQADQEPSAGQYVTSIQPSTSGPYCREGAIGRTLRGAKTAFGECSKASGGVSAEMIFQFTVTSGGEILRTENYSTSMDQSAASCILNEVKGLSFGAQSGGNCTVRVTLQLQPP